MTTITINGFIQAQPANQWDEGDHVVDGMKFDFWRFSDMSSAGHSLVCAHALTFEVPEGWDPRPDQIRALESKLAEEEAEHQKRVLFIRQQIANLQAIEYVPAEETL